MRNTTRRMVRRRGQGKIFFLGFGRWAFLTGEAQWHAPTGGTRCRGAHSQPGQETAAGRLGVAARRPGDPSGGRTHLGSVEGRRGGGADTARGGPARAQDGVGRRDTRHQRGRGKARGAAPTGRRRGEGAAGPRGEAHHPPSHRNDEGTPQRQGGGVTRGAPRQEGQPTRERGCGGSRGAGWRRARGQAAPTEVGWLADAGRAGRKRSGGWTGGGCSAEEGREAEQGGRGGAGPSGRKPTGPGRRRPVRGGGGEAGSGVHGDPAGGAIRGRRGVGVGPHELRFGGRRDL